MIQELFGQTLRGLAILLVLLWHYSEFIPTEGNTVLSKIVPLFKLTWSGVDLFFVLSGFLIGGILLDNRESGNYWSIFYLRRACRIFPLYFLMLAIFVLISNLASGALPWTLAGHIPNWSYSLFVQNFSMADISSFGANFLANMVPRSRRTVLSHLASCDQIRSATDFALGVHQPHLFCTSLQGDSQIPPFGNLPNNTNQDPF
jgi:peptidoglycan/LPS O-acetylase OafA/YrhL